MSTSCGSPCYAAPELVMNQGCYVGPAVDIWSCGVILFAMLCGYLPYDDDPANPESYNINLLYKYILNTPLVFPDYISEEACDLMLLMLVPDPDKRGTMEAIMAHPWLAPHRHLFALSNDQVVPETVPETKPVEQPALETTPQSDIPLVPQNNNTTTVTLEPVKSENDNTSLLELDTSLAQSNSIETQNETIDESAKEEEDSIVPTLSPKESIVPETPPSPQPSSKEPEQEEDNEPLSPLPTIKSASTGRPRSTSTEKMLSFLSPKPTHKKRARHISLATPEDSILHSKFLSSMKQSPIPNSSVSTPLKDTKPTPRPSTAPAGTRRKTLSLLVNSMDSKIPFAHKRQSRTPPEDILPSVSEHVAKKSAGKKFMDWFKKKPLSKQ